MGAGHTVFLDNRQMNGCRLLRGDALRWQARAAWCWCSGLGAAQFDARGTAAGADARGTVEVAAAWPAARQAICLRHGREGPIRQNLDWPFSRRDRPGPAALSVQQAARLPKDAAAVAAGRQRRGKEFGYAFQWWASPR
jgi:hypothetical protein